MTKQELNLIIAQIAANNRTTSEHVRKEMQKDMETARKNAAPSVQALWDAIPRKGSELTLY